ncbi:MAG: bifunctional fucokinase/L-fucose-1-P-guanylyltransferase [Clostridia bacterium]|nr:bifunctional fucokinase/L-fucose-1-P-guanylyltransferase [Clostridia bacterium]
MARYQNLFLRQGYLDTYEKYSEALKFNDSSVWDYVILTASNDAQAETYRDQIDYRLRHNMLPKSIHFAVIPDPDGKRVGSGGATLNVMRYIRSREPSFKGKKILVIHSGGDSKRIPQYSACGKLFSPVPRLIFDGKRSTIFDEFMISLHGIASRMSEGMLVCSGDVLLLFNPLQFEFYNYGAAAFSIKCPAEIGSGHGVYLSNDNDDVCRFLHKQSVDVLRSSGAEDSDGNVDIDTGAVLFSGKMCDDLYSLVDTQEGYDEFVNDKVRISFYADFLYSLAEDSTLENFYKETPEGEFSDELRVCREKLWKVLSGYSLHLIRFSPASFIHFGTTREMLSLMTDKISNYHFLDWAPNINTNNTDRDFSASNSYIDPEASVGYGSYIEDCHIGKGTVIGSGCVISCADISGETVPDNTVLHVLKLRDGRYVARFYGVNDNPKEPYHFGKRIDEPLWTYRCFPVCDTVDEAIHLTLRGEKTEEMTSLEESFNRADLNGIYNRFDRLRELVKTANIKNAVRKRIPIGEIIQKNCKYMPEAVTETLLQDADALGVDDPEILGTKLRLYVLLANISKSEIEKRNLFLSCFSAIKDAIIGGTEHLPVLGAAIQKDKVCTRLPARVNFGGGWTDTPPYCLEHGGAVLNSAIIINSEKSVVARIERIPEKAIVLESIDNGSRRVFTEISELRRCNDSGDPFILKKASLIVCGVIPLTGDVSLDEILTRIGGGFKITTHVHNIPLGSGLGTSSILAAACVKSICEFFGAQPELQTIYSCVLCMEQLMSTGGGWQDQAGGLTPGIKLLTSEPGIDQQIKCEHLELSGKTLDELNRRFIIIYTGQRRLAKNLLQNVVEKYLCSDRETLDIYKRITDLAYRMADALREGNIDEFAALLSEHWEYSKKFDSGCTNEVIDGIFDITEDLIEGRMICGAGGGGFLQAVMKNDVSADMVQQRIDAIYGKSDIKVWSCEF